jgi:hypothetical protein
MKAMKNIDDLLKEAEFGKVTRISERITEEAMPFWEQLENRIRSGVQLKPYVVHRLLREEFGIKISESAIRNHFSSLVEENENPF